MIEYIFCYIIIGLAVGKLEDITEYYLVNTGATKEAGRLYGKTLLPVLLWPVFIILLCFVWTIYSLHTILKAIERGFK